MLADLRLSDLVTFMAVHRHGSVSSAARHLGVTPSQVSKAVQRLEGQLGDTLLVRNHRGVALTEGGARLAPELDELLGLDRA